MREDTITETTNCLVNGETTVSNVGHTHAHAHAHTQTHAHTHRDRFLQFLAVGVPFHVLTDICIYSF